MSTPVNVLQLQQVTKVFPGVIANEQIDFTLKKGEIHTVLGENGAGKSTLMNVIFGLYPPDSGTIRVHGKKMNFRSPSQAIAHGIGMVHQHFMLIHNHTVAENIILGTRQKFVYNIKQVGEEIARLGEKYGLTVDPSKKIQELSVGEQQRVEILKVLYRGAKILILDEPTAVLTPQESESLYAIIKKMVQDQHSIIFISHKMKEVMHLSDRITVLHRGKVVGLLEKEQTSAQELAQLMMGDVPAPALEVQTVKNTVEKKTVVELKGVSAFDHRGHLALKKIDLRVHAGQIVGIAGVAGSGQNQLAEVLCGMREMHEGEYEYCGERKYQPSVATMIQEGVGFIPEDRKKYGISPNMSISENFLLREDQHSRFDQNGFLHPAKMQKYSQEKMQEFDVRAASNETHIGLLSGGNIQKVILARESSRQIRFLLAAQPIRGLDIHATAFIQQRLLQAKAKGVAILLMTEDLDELFFMSDHIYVMCGGEMVGSMPKEEATIEQIGLMMTGINRNQD